MSGEHTFQQLHDKIVEVLNYDSSQMASFFTIDKMGNRKREIALMDMSMGDEESDTLVMDHTRISDIIKPGCLELEYVFDFFANRYFRVEYNGEFVHDSSKTLPALISSQGVPPQQFSFDNDRAEWNIDEADEEDDYNGGGLSRSGRGGSDDDYDDSFMDEFENDSFDEEDRFDDDDDYGGGKYESLDDYIDRL